MFCYAEEGETLHLGGRDARLAAGQLALLVEEEADAVLEHEQQLGPRDDAMQLECRICTRCHMTSKQTPTTIALSKDRLILHGPRRGF